jgi:hypothetical protein
MAGIVIAALYVERGGPYFGIEGVDPWDEARDARTYAGPHPVVAHPPCERWGRYSKAERDAARASGRRPIKRLSRAQNIATPVAFRDLLLSIAKRAA